VSVVLLIDDEPQMAALVDMCLDDASVRVVQARDLAEARAAAGRERPLLVLLDLALGSEDGLKILPELRADPALTDVPVVVFSVHDSRREEVLAHHADAFIAKPFKAAELRTTLRAYLRGA
jgi:DNA-binding response OmpR family regulator